jgi:hypothetical protein
MKRHLVWFESLDAAGPSEAEAWATRGVEQRQGAVDTLRGDELSRLQRAVILDPAVRVTTGAARERRGRGRRSR